MQDSLGDSDAQVPMEGPDLQSMLEQMKEEREGEEGLRGPEAHYTLAPKTLKRITSFS